METGKTTKYLKYAIGEIILVVIGILIALSINNWNENRLDNKKSIDYQQRLLEDLDRVKLRSTDVLSKSEKVLTSIVDAIELLENGELISTKEKETFNYALLWYSRFNYQMPDLSTLEEMRSSGHLGLIYNKEIRMDIINFGSYLEYVESIFESTGQTIRNNRFIDKDVRYYTNPKSLEVKLSYDFNTLSKDKEFINSFSRITGHWRANVFFMKQIIKRTNLLKTKISEELKRLQND